MSTIYQVRRNGIESTHRSERKAVKAAAELNRNNGTEDAVVVMEVRSGTYRSMTVVWPVRGDTYSN